MLNVFNSNNPYGSSMSQKLPLNGFELIKNDTFTKDFIKFYEENSESFTLQSFTASNRPQMFLTVMMVAK